MHKVYAYHKPSTGGLEMITKLREAYSALHNTVLEVTGESRERSVALTNLEQSAMWAIKAVVSNDAGSIQE